MLSRTACVTRFCRSSPTRCAYTTAFDPSSYCPPSIAAGATYRMKQRDWQALFNLAGYKPVIETAGRSPATGNGGAHGGNDGGNNRGNNGDDNKKSSISKTPKVKPTKETTSIVKASSNKKQMDIIAPNTRLHSSGSILKEFIPKRHSKTNTWSAQLVRALNSEVKECKSFEEIIPRVLNSETKFEKLLMPERNFSSFSEMGATLRRDPKSKAPRLLADAMIALNMKKKLPEDGMKLFAATLLTHSRHEDSNIMFTVSESNTRKSTNFMKAVICMPNKSLYTVSSVPDLVGYKMAFYKHESTDRVSYAVMTNPVSAGVTEAKGDTSETYMGQACAQLVILGRIRFQQNLIEPNGTIIVYSFRFSQNFFQVIQATFPRGIFLFNCCVFITFARFLLIF